MMSLPRNAIQGSARSVEGYACAGDHQYRDTVAVGDGEWFEDA